MAEEWGSEAPEPCQASLWQRGSCQTNRAGTWKREQGQQGDSDKAKASLASPFQGFVDLHSLWQVAAFPGDPQVGKSSCTTPMVITARRGTEPDTTNTRTEKTHHAFDLYLYLHGLCGKTKGKKQGEEESVSKSRDSRHQAACYP